MGGHDQSQVKMKFKKFEKIESVPKTYQKVIMMTVMGVPGVLDVVLHLELLEPFGAGVVNILGIGDELRRGRRSIGSRHFKWRMG